MRAWVQLLVMHAASHTHPLHLGLCLKSPHTRYIVFVRFIKIKILPSAVEGHAEECGPCEVTAAVQFVASCCWTLHANASLKATEESSHQRTLLSEYSLKEGSCHGNGVHERNAVAYIGIDR